MVVRADGCVFTEFTKNFLICFQSTRTMYHAHNLATWGGNGPLIISIISLVIGYSLAVVQLYACYHFKSLQSLLIIQKRYPKLVIAEAIAVIFWLLFGLPFVTNAAFGATKYGLSTETFNQFKAYELVVSIALLHFSWMAEVIRLWLISYNLHYLHSSQNQQWKSQIDASFARNDWYLKNRNKYGSQKYLIPRAFVCYLCIVAIVEFIHIISYPNEWYFFAAAVDGLLGAVYMLSVFYMYFECRNHDKLRDKLYFHYEIRTTSIVWLISLLLYGCSQMMYLICFYVAANYYLNLFAGLLLVIVGTLSSLGPSLLSTLWIPRKIKWDALWFDERFGTSEVRMAAFVHLDQSLTNALNETLKNEEQFELFIRWMYREFSFEAGLCFIELVQFKEQLIDYIKQKDGNKTQEFDTRYIDLLYHGVPKSSIVFDYDLDGDGMEKFQWIAHLLFEKYVRVDAEFEINICHALRSKYIKLDEQNWNIELNEFVNVFEKIIVEMFFFMLQSFARYQTHAMKAPS